MLLECCSQERTYLRYYGLLGQRFCMINKVHQENFETCFVNQYSMIHCLETNKLRNVAKFFPHLLGTDALPWHVLSYIRLTEEDIYNLIIFPYFYKNSVPGTFFYCLQHFPFLISNIFCFFFFTAVDLIFLTDRNYRSIQAYAYLMKDSMIVQCKTLLNLYFPKISKKHKILFQFFHFHWAWRDHRELAGVSEENASPHNATAKASVRI